MMFYILNVALILAGCFIFYKALLQKETFFPLNRFILLGCLALSFSIPFIPIPAQFSFRAPTSTLSQFIEPSSSLKENESQTAEAINKPIVENTSGTEIASKSTSVFKDISLVKILVWTYWLGVIVFSINFIVQLLTLIYRAYSSPVIKDGRYRIIELSGNQAPCSFGNNIFINPEKYDWDTYSQIILHEKIHIQQGHSYDIILAELAIVFQWFNPFAWLYRKAMEDNLEFLTDNELLAHSDVEPSSYKMSLVKVSAPHFPISLTTNYNQSILKKRLIMMNAKKSNVNSTWKYLFLVPLLLIFISFLNEPIAYGKSSPVIKSDSNYQVMEDEGSWFATIKNEKVTIRFEFDEEKKSNNSTSFSLAEFKDLPRDSKGNFTLSREAGSIAFTGRFEGNTGMGTYKFIPNQSFINFLAEEGVSANKDKDAMVFFMINLKRGFVKMLKKEGYTDFSKNDLIPLCALNVTEDYIKSLKKAGLSKLSLQDLVPLKALNIDGEYVADIKSAGYKNIDANRLITLKAQGIDGAFLKANKNANNEISSSPIVAKPAPIAKINTKTNHKTNGDDEGYSELGIAFAKKILNITAAFAKEFDDAGFKFNDEELLAMKTLGVTPAYCKSFDKLGFGKLSSESFISMKALGLTPEDYIEYKKLGFNSLSLEDVISAKATGTTPKYISEMKKKGYNYNSIDKYVEKKVLL